MTLLADLGTVRKSLWILGFLEKIKLISVEVQVVLGDLKKDQTAAVV